MKTVKLGNSNLQVSQIGLGTMAFGRWISETDSVAILNHAVNAGINLIDTADYYGPGQDEKRPMVMVLLKPSLVTGSAVIPEPVQNRTSD